MNISIVSEVAFWERLQLETENEIRDHLLHTGFGQEIATIQRTKPLQVKLAVFTEIKLDVLNQERESRWGGLGPEG